MILIIKTDGSVSEFKPAGKRITLEEMQKIVGGYIEMLHLDGRSKKVLVVNEEGKLKNLPINHKATLMAKSDWIQDIIVGDVIFADSEDID